MRARSQVFFLVLAGAARAADPAQAPVDAIAAAKSDLAAIRAPLLQQETGTSLPSLDMKDVGTVPGAVHFDVNTSLIAEDELGPDGQRKKKEGTGNWLVDAMDKKSERSPLPRGREKEDLLKGDLDLLRGDGAGRGGKEALQSDEGREKSAESDSAAHPYNPLDSFMSGWITAKDHDLLMPATKGGDGVRSRGDSLQSLELGPAASTADASSPAGESSPQVDSKPSANPYLAELDPLASAQIKAFNAPEAAPFPTLEGTDIPKNPTLTGVDPKPANNAHAYIPDFALPSDDDKYFKQLKRF